MTQRSVLIVDDDHALLEALPKTIELHAAEADLVDARIDTCDNARTALAKIAAVDYDVIVTDIKMPGMDGLALLAEIGRVRPDTPTLLITGHGESELAIEALRGGAYDFIQKPIDRLYFVNSLARAIDLRDLRRTVAEQRAALERHALELEERVQQRTSELERANQAKDEFLGLVSHELRTPITIILGNASTLQTRADHLDPESKEAALRDIRDESERLHRIVENMLVLARTDAPTEIEVEPVLVGRALRSLAERHAKRFRNREVTCRIDDDLPPVAAVSTYIELVVTNLLSNAEKYSPRTEPIEIAAYASGDDVTVAVRDRGYGVEPDEIDQLFDPFFRARRLSTSAAGVGIGLTVCKQLVELQGGRIEVLPREGGGTEVRFSLPIEPVSAEAPQAAAAAMAR